MSIVIGYTSEPVEEYQADLDAAVTLATLKLVTEKWKAFASDAWVIVEAMSEADFVAFRKALKLERRGKFMGEKAADKFSAIIMPELMFRVSIIADQFKAPWGCAFIRLKDVGRIVRSTGNAYKFTEPSP
jgi:hypothetical protein